MYAQRPVRLPADDFHRHPLPVSEEKGLEAMRVHAAAYPAAQFRAVPSHRFSHPAAPGGLLYMAFDLRTCLWECYGDAILNPGSAVSRAVWLSRQISTLRSKASLKICDLTDTRTRRHLGVDISALMHPDLSIPQAWGLAIQSHPDQVDGLRYLSRFTNQPCLALFERDGLAAKITSSVLASLGSLDEADAFLEENRIALI